MSKSVECSRCGTLVTFDGEQPPPFCPDCGAQLEMAQLPDVFDAHVDYFLPAPPHGSRIEVIDASNDRLMLSIPPGGKRAYSLGCFGIVWMLITGAVTGGFGLAAFQQDGPPWFVFLFLSLFWLVGILLLGLAIRLKYTRGYLFLSADRAVHQRILFGWKRNTEVTLDESSYAHLVESYQENDVPVYRVQIDGTDGSIRYGTGMDRECKEWYVATINQFLGFLNESQSPDRVTAANRDEFGDFVPTQSCPACGQIIPDADTTQCVTCGARLERSGQKIVSARITEAVSPESLPPGFPVRVSKSAAGEWEVAYAMRSMADNFRGGGCLLAFGAMWETFIIAFTGGVLLAPGFMKVFMLLFTVPFHLIGMVLTLIGLFTILGSFRLRLGPDKSSARWGIGLLGYTNRFSTSAITEVNLIRGQALSSFKKTQHNQAPRSRSEGISCILMAAGKRIPVTSGTKEQDSRLTAGLIRHCLRDLGYRLQDE